MTGGKS